MPAVTRLGDMGSGHGGFAPRACTEGSPNVFINGIPAHRQGDAWGTHCDSNSCHASTMAGGSSTVFVNGKPLARIGDDVACGSVSAQGSPSVFAGG